MIPRGKALSCVRCPALSVPLPCSSFYAGSVVGSCMRLIGPCGLLPLLQLSNYPVRDIPPSAVESEPQGVLKVVPQQYVLHICILSHTFSFSPALYRMPLQPPNLQPPARTHARTHTHYAACVHGAFTADFEPLPLHCATATVCWPDTIPSTRSAAPTA